VRQANPAINALEEVLSKKQIKELWTSIYTPVLPFTPQTFAIEAVLPAVMYMFRSGTRRGSGRFAANFGADGKVHIEDVARVLSERTEWFENFEGDVGQAILGDLLLTFSLENKQHSLGRSEQVQRVFPTHYFASWIDLPPKVTDLRNIPEMIVALLVEQKEGTHIETGVRSRFTIGTGFEDNDLLRLFGSGTSIEGAHASNLRADCFDEEEKVGIDQLLTIRTAQICGERPQKLKGPSESARIPNRRPLATLASNNFVRDFSVFIQAYGQVIPRQSLLPMLESCLSLGISNIYLSTLKLLLAWEHTGKVAPTEEQTSWPLFVDCSSGSDTDLRKLAEECLDDCMRRMDRIPVALMCLRILDQIASDEDDIKGELNKAKVNLNSSVLLELLGSIRQGDHEGSKLLMRDLKKLCSALSDVLETAEEDESAIQVLRNTNIDAALRLAEALVILMKNQRDKYVQALDSSFMIDSPHGLAKKRSIFIAMSGKRRRSDARSIVLTNTMLDFLVHRHLRQEKKGKPSKVLTLVDFISILRSRYGLFIDQSPPGMSIPGEMLLKNRARLERRLRDLGVLQGVNDAESMKRLKPRFVEMTVDEAE
jgi:Holliday junction resolvasome RuvABC endonuclease subunit